MDDSIILCHVIKWTQYRGQIIDKRRIAICMNCSGLFCGSDELRRKQCRQIVMHHIRSILTIFAFVNNSYFASEKSYSPQSPNSWLLYGDWETKPDSSFTDWDWNFPIISWPDQMGSWIYIDASLYHHDWSDEPLNI